METNTEIFANITALQGQLQIANTELATEKANLAARLAEVQRLEGMLATFKATGDVANESYTLDMLLPPQYTLKAQLDTSVAAKQRIVDDIIAQIAEATANLTPEQSAAVAAQAQQTAANASLTATQANIAGKAANYAVTHSKTLTISGLVILAIVLLIVGYKLFFAKIRPVTAG